MMRFLTLIVNGLQDANKRMVFLQWWSHLSVDFVCLQETHVLSVDECTSWFSSHGFLAVCSPGSVHSCGSVIIFQPFIHWLIFGKMMWAVLSWPSFPFTTFPSQLFVCTPQTEILKGMIFSHRVVCKLIPRFQHLLVVISMLSLIGISTGAAPLTAFFTP